MLSTQTSYARACLGRQQLMEEKNGCLLILSTLPSLQYIELKESCNFKMGNLTLTESLSALYDFFLNFVVAYET